jgi:hypothetical protein
MGDEDDPEMARLAAGHGQFEHRDILLSTEGVSVLPITGTDPNAKNVLAVQRRLLLNPPGLREGATEMVRVLHENGNDAEEPRRPHRT